MTTEIILKGIISLEETVETLNKDINILVEKTYKDALREYTSMSEAAIYTSWLRYNAANDRLEV